MFDFVRQRATATALSAATVIVGLQLILPAMFDLIFDILLLGLIWFAGKFSAR